MFALHGRARRNHRSTSNSQRRSAAFSEPLESRVLLSGYAVETLATFHGSNGAFPLGGVIDVGGNLYGTTDTGGNASDGTVFEYNASTKVLSTVATFHGSNGSNPNGLIDAGGNLYGTTSDGGSGAGTVFEYNTSTKVLSAVATFHISNGVRPLGNLLDVGGNLYGTTSGFVDNDGTVFEYNTSTKILSTIATFQGGSGGKDPQAGLIDVGGNLYGTTYAGANGNDGTVFEYKFSTKSLITIATFNQLTGIGPSATLIDVGGNLYGTTSSGGYAPPNSDGVLFDYNTATKSLTDVFKFDGFNGVNPLGNLIDVGGNLVGTTQKGGSANDGTVFEYNTTTKTLSTSATFNGSNGAKPTAGVIDIGGDLYGTASYGGSANGGTLFEIAPIADTPVITPGAGTYTGSVSVKITDATAGVPIRYTTNGATPTSSSTLYTGPFTVSDNQTVKAVAVSAVYAASAVASVTYAIPADAPAIAPAAGTYTNPLTVFLSDGNFGATIYYTTNGSTPTVSSTRYTKPFVLTKAATVKAIAIAPGHSMSPVSSASYTLIPGGVLTGSQTTAASSYDLSTLGTTDWANWTPKYNHKAGSKQISNDTAIVGLNFKGENPSHFGTSTDSSRSVNWTNGLPTESDTSDDSFLWATGEFSGFSFVVPALTTTQTLYIYAGGMGPSAVLQAHLSDGTAPDVTMYAKTSGKAVYTDLFKITFKAGTPGATLTVSYTNTFTTGRADLIAAALT